MLIATLIMAAIAGSLVLIGFLKGENQQAAGLQRAWNMTLQILPLLIFAFIAAGMIQVLLPRELIVRWIGDGSGLRGILVGTLAGSFVTGGPYVSLPLAAGFLKAGAGIGTVVAFLTGWSLWAFSRWPLEFGILGWKVALIRFASTFLFAPIAGLLAHWLAGMLLRN